jgi:hypothetical protein
VELLALANFMRLSLMKAAQAGVGGGPCRKSGYVGRKRWAKPYNRLQPFRALDPQPRTKVDAYGLKQLGGASRATQGGFLKALRPHRTVSTVWTCKGSLISSPESQTNRIDTRAIDTKQVKIKEWPKRS